MSKYAPLLALNALLVVLIVLTPGTLLREDSKVLSIPEESTTELLANPELFTETWSPLIKDWNPERAYDEFLKTYVVESPHTQHKLAHLFGYTLYFTAGPSGVTACDHQFNGGCFHEFIGRAIHDRGLAIVSELNEECLKVPSDRDTCQHGIGHGLTGYLGYHYKDLGEALEICGELPGQSRVEGCFGGIFMEYNSEVLLATEGQIRPLVSDLGHHYPCDSIRKGYREACYYYQPQWWVLLSGDKWNTDEERMEMFNKIENLCSEVVEASERMYCYRGTGLHGTVVVDGNTEEMLFICEGITDFNGEVECRGGAARSPFLKLPSTMTPWEIMCSGLPREQKNSCIHIAQAPE